MRRQGRGRELLANIGVFGLGTLGAKIMQMLLVPLYTVYMSTEEFGTADMVSSTVSLLSPLLTMELGNGLLRFVLGQEENEKSASKLCALVALAGTTLLLVVLPAFRMTGIFGSYYYMIPVIYFLTTLQTYLAQLCKAKDMNVVYAANGVLQSVALSVLCIAFLAIMHLGVGGYLWAIALSHTISVVFLGYQVSILRILRGSHLDRGLTREMMEFSLPLIPNDVSWWVIQMSDRYMVTFFCGAALNGVYAIAYKIPGIFNLLVSIFIQAFGISAIREGDAGEMVDGKLDGSFFERVFHRYLGLTFAFAAVVILVSRPLASVFLKNGFYQSWKYTPLLLTAFAIGNLQAFYGSILSGIKDTKTISTSTMCGMVANIILNLVLIPSYNAYGASVATIASYVIVYAVRLHGIRRSVSMDNFVVPAVASSAVLMCASLLYTVGSWIALALSIILCMGLVIYWRETFIEGYRFVVGRFAGKGKAW